MASHLTLEEAAEQLGISPEEFKKKLKTDTAFKTLVPIRDGSNLRFKSTAIEELARQLGAASDPGLPLAPLESDTPLSDDFKVDSAEPRKEAKLASEEPLNLTSSSDDLFTLSSEEPKPEPKKKKPGSDSDVRLESGKGKKGKPVTDDSSGEAAAVVPTEELSIDFNGPGSAVIKGGSSAKLSAPKSSGKIPKPDSGKGLAAPGNTDSSEFELSLDADSDDFELKLNTDTSDEVDLGELPKDASGSSRRGGESGINLKDPADSGISLEKSKAKSKGKDSDKLKKDSDKLKKGDSDKHKKGDSDKLKKGDSGDKLKKGDSGDKLKSKPAAPIAEGDSSDDVDFELTLDSSAAASGLKLGALKSGKGVTDPDSDSEFELTLDDSGDSGLEAAASDSADAEKRDIFETDFEIPPMDESGSEAVALDPDSDLERADSDIAEMVDSDVAVDDSGSEAVVLEDEDEAPKAKKKTAVKKAKADSDDEDVDLADVDLADEEDASASKALKGLKGRRPGEEDEEEAEAAPVPAGVHRPAPWGVVPALFLLPSVAIGLVGCLLAFELLQTMWGYQQPKKPAAPLVRAIASNLDLELRDQ